MRIYKFNEYNNNTLLLKELIGDVECIPTADLVEISESEPYRMVVSFGYEAIPYIFKSNLLKWSIALTEITNDKSNVIKKTTTERIKYWKDWGEKNGYC